MTATITSDERLSTYIKRWREQGNDSSEFVRPYVDERRTLPPEEFKSYDRFINKILLGFAFGCRNTGDNRGVDFLLDAVDDYKRMIGKAD